LTGYEFKKDVRKKKGKTFFSSFHKVRIRGTENTFTKGGEFLDGKELSQNIHSVGSVTGSIPVTNFPFRETNVKRTGFELL
jgi:hypothetical protein